VETPPRLKDRRTTTDKTTSHLTKLVNDTNQVIGYALADTALKNGSESSFTFSKLWFFAVFCLVSTALATLCGGL
jgi:hypothetical protein